MQIPDTLHVISTSATTGPSPWVTFTAAVLTAVAAATVSGLISYFLQERKLRAELERERERVRTEYMAEQVARRLLTHEAWTKRSFAEIRRRLSGFEEDELRKILIRAGAVRFGRDDDELWGLLERNTSDV